MHYAQSGDRLCSPQRIEEISLTDRGESGLMRPVARIAQSVEQGIENPRVLGSIPSPGTTYSENPAYGWVFAFGDTDSPSNYVRLFAASGSPLRGQRDRRAVQRLTALVRVRAPLIQRTQPMAGFLLLGIRLSIELRSIIRHRPHASSGTDTAKRVG